MPRKTHPVNNEKQAHLERVRLTPENQKYLEGRLAQQVEKYKNHQTASLNEAYQAFSFLSSERRQAFLNKDDHGFFRLLIKSGQENLVQQVLTQGSPEEQVKMQTIIHRDLERGLKQAIADGDVSRIDHYMHFFPSAQTKDIIQSVVAGDDYASLRATKNNQKAIINYFLGHELTKDGLQDRFLPQTKQKPQASSQRTQSYFSSIKERLQSMVGANQATKVHPGQGPEEKGGDDLTDSETNSERSDSSRNRI